MYQSVLSLSPPPPHAEDDLFFLNPIPPTASIFTNRSELCAVPDIPTANVTIVNESNPRTGNDYFYCRVETERGIFRSRSVISLPGGSFGCGRMPLLCWQMALIVCIVYNALLRKIAGCAKNNHKLHIYL